MSKTIAVVNNGSQQIAISSMKLGKKEVVSDERVSSWLEESSSGEAPLTSILPVTANLKHSGKHIHFASGKYEREASDGFILVITGAIGAIVGTMVASVFMEVQEAIPGFMVLLGSVGIGTGLGAFGWRPFVQAYSSSYAILWSKLMSVQSQGMQAWLETRYNIQVTAEVLQEMATFVLRNDSTIPFTDVNGQLWMLGIDQKIGKYVVEPQQASLEVADTPALMSQAPVTVSVGVKDLPVEVQSVVDLVDARVAQLHQFALTTEEAHIVSRAIKDAQEAVMTFEQLRILGAEASGVVQLVNVMKVLLSELECVAKKKATEASERLASRQALVNARQDKVEV